MTTCREIFTFSWPLLGRGRGGSTQAVSLTAFSQFFFWPLPLIFHQKFLPIFVHQKLLTSIMRNSRSLHCLVEMSPFEAVDPGKTRRPGPVPTNNEMIKHKNKWWKIKTKGKKIKPRKELPEYGQDYAGDAFLCIASISLHFTASICISLHLSPFLCILSFIF